MNKKVNSIVAVSLNNGIGKNGDLPWRLSKELKQFSKITTSTINPSMQNAVVMGRKTWLSMPEKRRPLIKRMNIVLSKTMNLDLLPDDKPKPHHIFNDLVEAIDFLNKQDNIENIFIIGGERVYKSILELNLCDRIYLTKVLKEFDCDAFYPSIDEQEQFQLIETDDVPIGLQEENDIKYEYLVYERKRIEI